MSSHCRMLLLVIMLVVPGESLAGFEDQLDRYGPEVVVGGVTAMGTERLYLVQENDTLWDLSEEFYFDSMMWPTLWALNPQITNPHWIYPGDVLFIHPPGTQTQTTSVVWSASRYNESPRNLIIQARTMGFIAKEDYQESGIVRFSREEKEMISKFDEAYLEFTTARSVRVGDEYTIYRVDRPIDDPKTSEEIGRLVRFLGVVRILDTSKDLVRGVVLTSYEEIYRGDLVTGIFPHQTVVEPVENTVELAASIVDSYQEIDYYGQHQYVFIDRGRKDGIEPGNRFVMRERGDAYLRTHRTREMDVEMDLFPWEHAGSIMVVESYDDHSLGIVTGSIHAVQNGQELYMFANY